jgi:uncharacterized protein (DUF1501 family)
MTYNRREFLGLASTLLTTSATVPAFLQRTAWAATRDAAAKDRVLVVLQLTGGNDGLNTVVPFTDDNYRRLRPKLQLADAKLHKLDARVGLHPDLEGLKKLYDEGLAGIVQSVGYPNPNRSHFESMAIWNIAPDDEQLRHGKAAEASGGWLARAIDESGASRAAGASRQALRIGAGEMPQALLGCRVPVPSLADLAQLKHRAGLLERSRVEQQVAAWRQGAIAAGNPLLQAAIESGVAVHATAQQIEDLKPEAGSGATYPDTDLAKRFRLIAQLIRAGFATSIYYTELDGFDTHSSQLFRHANVLRTVGGALEAFIKDVQSHAPTRPVLVLVFSEFGRRLAENASEGTDHGTAAPVLLAGTGAVPGVHGPYPDLAHLVDDDPVFAIDFRRVYATVLEQWLGVRSERVLNQRFEALDILKPSPT